MLEDVAVEHHVAREPVDVLARLRDLAAVDEDVVPVADRREAADAVGLAVGLEERGAALAGRRPVELQSRAKRESGPAAVCGLIFAYKSITRKRPRASYLLVEPAWILVLVVPALKITLLVSYMRWRVATESTDQCGHQADDRSAQL